TMAPSAFKHLRRSHDGGTVYSHIRGAFRAGVAHAGRRGEPAFPEQAFSVADGLRGRQPIPERLYAPLPAGVGPAKAGSAQRRHRMRFLTATALVLGLAACGSPEPPQPAA